jgi:hypothetical protein
MITLLKAFFAFPSPAVQFDLATKRPDSLTRRVVIHAKGKYWQKYQVTGRHPVAAIPANEGSVN